MMKCLLAVSFTIVALCLVHAAGAAGLCTPNELTLCIDEQPGDGRFQMRVTFRTTQGAGASGNGHAVSLTSLSVNQGGLMWFFSRENPELLLKILLSCSANGHYWVFASAGTNVGLTITVTDLKTGAQRVYTNPDLQAMTPIQDIQAFPCTGTPPVTPPVDPLLAKTELLKGHWHFVYTISTTTFTDDYNLTTIPGTTNSQGGFFIHGTNQYNGPVAASYFPKDGNYALLDPGTIIDQFYTFHTDGKSILPGSCYYLINPPGSLNFSRCYTLTGVKTPLANQNIGRQLDEEDARAREAAEAEVHPTVLEQYRMLRGQ